MSLRYSTCFRFQHQRQLAWSILITKEIVGIQLEIKDNLPASCICIFSPLSCSTARLHFSEYGNRKSPNLWTVNFEPWTVTSFLYSLPFLSGMIMATLIDCKENVWQLRKNSTSMLPCIPYNQRPIPQGGLFFNQYSLKFVFKAYPDVRERLKFTFDQCQIKYYML